MDHIYYARGSKLNNYLSNKFLRKNTLFLDKEWRGAGFLVNSSYCDKIAYLLQPFMYQKHGAYKVRFLIPNFDKNAAAVLLLIPEHVSKSLKNAYVTVNGTVDELSRYITIGGRIILISDLDYIDMNQIFREVAPAIDEHRLLNMIDESVDSSIMNKFLKFFYISSPLYFNKSGGIGAYFINYDPDNSKLSRPTFEELKYHVKEIESVIHPLFKSGVLYYTNVYDANDKISKKFQMPVRYAHKAEEESSKLLKSRTEALEMTFTVLKSGEPKKLSRTQKSILSYIDQPLLVSREDLEFGLEELKEYSLDIGHLALLKHFSNVQAELNAAEAFETRARLLRVIEKNVPEMKECLENNVFFSDGLYDGMGEQAMRMIGSMKRYGLDTQTIEQIVSEHMTELLDRIFDQYSPQIKKELAELKFESAARRREKIATRTVLELNWFRPDGWYYSDFEKLMLERDFESSAIEKIFYSLIENKTIYEAKKGCYKAIL